MLLTNYNMGKFRQMVLSNFKKLHRTRLKVFDSDERLLNAARIKINEEYQKHKNVTDEESIKALLKLGEDVEKELRTHIIQAREVRPGVYAARITQDTEKIVNIPFQESADIKTTTDTPCCQDQNKRE